MTEPSISPDADAWMCDECGFLWSGKDRAPPYPFCPECENTFLRRLFPTEVPIAEKGFIPSRLTC